MKLSGIDWGSVLTTRGLVSIISGCASHIINKAGLQTELVASVIKYRLDMVCASCDINNDGQCDPTRTGSVIVDFLYHGTEERKKGDIKTGCGCNLMCKTANLSEQCPLGKWLQQD